MKNTNFTMLTDFYELTMANGYFEAGMTEDIAYFDMFFRKIPDGGGFAIMAGVEQLVEYMKELHFTEEDLDFLRNKGIFDERFLDYLRHFEFQCDVWSVPEGTPIFPDEPLVTVRGPVIQAQFVETMVLLLINHQSLIATKANRIVRAAEGRGVMEFGTRRAHGTAAAIYGARAAYIGGCMGTACTVSERDHGILALGTMAHSWVQMYSNEYEAFKKYAEIYPENCVFLVDTYNVLSSGIPNAIKVFKEMKPKKMGVRIDSGDIAYLTKRTRQMLDDAGLKDCTIVVSNSLDEYIIQDVLMQGACIDTFGVGERLITAKSDPVFGGVYKLSALERDGMMIPKMKISENVDKITNPGFKTLYRLYSNKTNQCLADLIVLDDEEPPKGEPFEIFDPKAPWKRQTVTDYYAKNLRVPLFVKGECVYDFPTIDEIRDYCKEQVSVLWAEMLRFERPQLYYVDLSKKLFNLKKELIEQHSKD
jgi:nicotinate phosphoribosyltransferase